MDTIFMEPTTLWPLCKKKNYREKTRNLQRFQEGEFSVMKFSGVFKIIFLCCWVKISHGIFSFFAMFSCFFGEK